MERVKIISVQSPDWRTHIVGHGSDTLCGISGETYIFRYYTNKAVTCSTCIKKFFENEKSQAETKSEKTSL